MRKKKQQLRSFDLSFELLTLESNLAVRSKNKFELLGKFGNGIGSPRLPKGVLRGGLRRNLDV
jgi:hypothetical protein